jgi:antitoxin component of MazEF toxin-antitoxin module
MQSVKARKQGNATVVTIPAAIKVPLDTEFYVFMNQDGSITFVPKLANYYKASNLIDGTFWQAEEFSDTELQGREAI